MMIIKTALQTKEKVYLEFRLNSSTTTQVLAGSKSVIQTETLILMKFQKALIISK